MSKSGKNSLLFNKIAAGVLTTGLILWGVNRVTHVFTPGEPPKPAATQPAPAPSPAPVTASTALASITPLIASADVAKGQALVKQQCAACHTLTPGGADGMGPNLYNAVGGPMFAHAGFAYSDAVKAKAKGNWDYDNLNAWLAAPQSFAPGTRMFYAGIKNTQTRADVVAYLRTLAATPLALPSATQASAAAAPPPAAIPPSIGPLFASVDIAKGQALVQQQCAACHTLAKGGANGMGPNLYGIVGAKAFSAPGFSYSDAVKAKSGTPWTADALSAWLQSPATYAPGTRMFYPGIKNDQTRADVIAYLNKNSDNPAKLP
ncbi:MAG: cytochrome c family protein [Acidocella sp.]|nr:cytochrome c family protein [Acidocella sp.]